MDHSCFGYGPIWNLAIKDVKQRVLAGGEGTGYLRLMIQSLVKRHVLLVVDDAAYKVCGARAVFESVLEPYEVTILRLRTQLPDVTVLVELVARLQQGDLLSQIEAIIAVGGGTTLDLAKLIRWVGHGLEVEQLGSQSKGVDPNEISPDPLDIPLIAAPTTSGSGSEATHFAVLYANNIKHSIAHSSLLPEVVYLNPAFTATLPGRHRAATAWDALAQSIESFWAVGATEASQVVSTEALELAWTYLGRHILRPDEETREAMSKAAYLAGKAINQAKTTASHALSYTMTSAFGVPHGIAVALTLGPLLVYNAGITEADTNDPRGVEYVRETLARLVAILGCTSPEEAGHAIRRLLWSTTQTCFLKDAGIISDADRARIVRGVNTERLTNNPRELTAETIADLVMKAA